MFRVFVFERMMSVASSTSASAVGYGQLQRQAALRNAERLEAQARALAAQAREARQAADAAERKADELEIEAGSARSDADRASQAVMTGEGARKVANRIGRQAEKIAQALQAGDDAKNLYGRTGRPTSSAYPAGSLLKSSA